MLQLSVVVANRKNSLWVKIRTKIWRIVGKSLIELYVLYVPFSVNHFKLCVVDGGISFARIAYLQNTRQLLATIALMSRSTKEYIDIIRDNESKLLSSAVGRFDYCIEFLATPRLHKSLAAVVHSPVVRTCSGQRSRGFRVVHYHSDFTEGEIIHWEGGNLLIYDQQMDINRCWKYIHFMLCIHRI